MCFTDQSPWAPVPLGLVFQQHSIFYGYCKKRHVFRAVGLPPQTTIYQQPTKSMQHVDRTDGTGDEAEEWGEARMGMIKGLEGSGCSISGTSKILFPFPASICLPGSTALVPLKIAGTTGASNPEELQDFFSLPQGCSICSGDRPTSVGWISLGLGC